ncbi:hypothetical protein D3C84_1143350 [compost metagenome]
MLDKLKRQVLPCFRWKCRCELLDQLAITFFPAIMPNNGRDNESERITGARYLARRFDALLESRRIRFKMANDIFAVHAETDAGVAIVFGIQ